MTSQGQCLGPLMSASGHPSSEARALTISPLPDSRTADLTSRGRGVSCEGNEATHSCKDLRPPPAQAQAGLCPPQMPSPAPPLPRASQGPAPLLQSGAELVALGRGAALEAPPRRSRSSSPAARRGRAGLSRRSSGGGRAGGGRWDGPLGPAGRLRGSGGAGPPRSPCGAEPADPGKRDSEGSATRGARAQVTRARGARGRRGGGACARLPV